MDLAAGVERYGSIGSPGRRTPSKTGLSDAVVDIVRASSRTVRSSGGDEPEIVAVIAPCRIQRRPELCSGGMRLSNRGTISMSCGDDGSGTRRPSRTRGNTETMITPDSTKRNETNRTRGATWRAMNPGTVRPSVSECAPENPVGETWNLDDEAVHGTTHPEPVHPRPCGDAG